MLCTRLEICAVPWLGQEFLTLCPMLSWMRQSLFCNILLFLIFSQSKKRQRFLVRKSKLTSAKHIVSCCCRQHNSTASYFSTFKGQKKFFLPPIFSLLFMYFQMSATLWGIISILPNVNSLCFNRNLAWEFDIQIFHWHHENKLNRLYIIFHYILLAWNLNFPLPRFFQITTV